MGKNFGWLNLWLVPNLKLVAAVKYRSTSSLFHFVTWAISRYPESFRLVARKSRGYIFSDHKTIDSTFLFFGQLHAACTAIHYIGYDLEPTITLTRIDMFDESRNYRSVDLGFYSLSLMKHQFIQLTKTGKETVTQ